MSQDPNAKVGIDASEIGANAAETGERDLSHHQADVADVVDDHEAVHEPLDFHELAEQGHAATALDREGPPPGAGSRLREILSRTFRVPVWIPALGTLALVVAARGAQPGTLGGLYLHRSPDLPPRPDRLRQSHPAPRRRRHDRLVRDGPASPLRPGSAPAQKRLRPYSASFSP